MVFFSISSLQSSRQNGQAGSLNGTNSMLRI
jgi:hypothetical protein